MWVYSFTPPPTSLIKVKNTPSKVRLKGDHFKFTFLKCLKFCQNFNLYVFRHARRDTSETHWRIRINAHLLRWIRVKQEQWLISLSLIHFLPITGRGASRWPVHQLLRPLVPPAHCGLYSYPQIHGGKVRSSYCSKCWSLQ